MLIKKIDKIITIPYFMSFRIKRFIEEFEYNSYINKDTI
jgi:hypothetical protein